MFSKNIIFKNFKQLNKKNQNKRIEKLLKKELVTSSRLLSSLKTNYKYSFKSKDIKKFKNYKLFNLIGIGGSILGTEAIYDFLYHKVKKKFKFYNNLINHNILKSKKKKC